MRWNLSGRTDRTRNNFCPGAEPYQKRGDDDGALKKNPSGFSISQTCCSIYLRRHNAQALPTESSPTGCTEVTVGTEAGTSGGGDRAEAAGDRATHTELLSGDTWEERAEGAAQLPQESQRVYLPSPADGEDVFTEGTAELRVHSHRSR